MILFPPAKINLGLNVLRRRKDGYHELDTCMITISLCDVLEILPAKEFSFLQSGLNISGEFEQNLVVKAYRLMQREFQVGPVYIHLLKNIPMGAGLGGGSADATYTIKALNDLFELNLSFDRMRELAGELGSDCPFFVENIPQIAKGRGEVLSSIDIDLKGYFLKIVNANIHIGTAESYAGVKFYKGANSLSDALFSDISKWKEVLQNSFEVSALQKNSILKEVKNKLYEEGAIYASMTGSGSTMFGIFKNEPKYSYPNLFERILEM